MTRAPLHPVRRAARAAAAVTATGIVVNGLRLRSRGGALVALDPAGGADSDGATWEVDGWRCISATGVSVAPRTVSSAVAWAEAEGLDAVDLVPADLDVERVLDLWRQVEFGTFRDDPLVEGRTAGHALLVRADVAKRADLPDGPVPPAELIDVARQVKRFAPRTTDFVVAPHEHAVDQTPSERLAVQRTVFDRYSLVNVAASVAELAVLAAGPVGSPALGAAALGLHAAQPALVLGGNAAGLRPRDLGTHAPLRWWNEVRRVLGLTTADAPPPRSLRVAEEVRPAYRQELAGGTDHFFEPRSATCPWCQGTDLVRHVESPDLIQHKPGTFELDRCRSCGHVFQNPRLTTEGLDFYYRDFYDGFAGDEMEKVFASEAGEYDGRAQMVAAHLPSPARWLDVGTGHGHFCLVASGYFPETTFEGVEQSSSVDDAAHRGWIDRAHRGLFPEVAPSLAGRFDVVSMLHYLEHTREPFEELDAAAVALAPGGLLMIELPDPECPSADRLGRYWMPWLQPQHQHFVSIDRLEAALEDRGFTVLDRYRAPYSPGPDALAALWLAAGQVVPRQWMPWRPEPTSASRLARMVAVSATLPAMVAALVAGPVESAVRGGSTPGNAFRVLARLGPA